MAVIKSTIVLDDKYSSKAEKIASSTNAMGEAMKKSIKVASSMGSALKSAFDRTNKVKISEVGSKETRAKIYKLNNDLKAVTGKPLNFEITTKIGKIDHVKNKLEKMSNSINKKMDSAFKKPTKFVDNMHAFKDAKRQAKEISRDLKELTGKRHKIKIDMENPIKKAFKGGMSSMFSGLKTGMAKAGGFFSKMNPFGGGNHMSMPMMGGGGGMLGSIVKGNLITGAITKGLGAMKSGMDTVFGSGMTRLENIQASKARLKGFGHDEKTVDTISKNAMEAVTGTAYGFGDAMTASANAVAAGIKPGEDLTRHLKLIGNAAAATGSDFNEMGSIFNKVKTTGYLQGDEARQIMDRGIALLPALADTMGESIDSVRKKMSKGEISFDDFSKAMEKASGNVAEEMSNTFSGAKDNLKAALGRIGANLLGGSSNEEGVFGAMVPIIKSVTNALKGIEPVAKTVGDSIGKSVTEVINTFNRIKFYGEKAMGPVFDKFQEVGRGLQNALAPLRDSISSMFGDGFNAKEMVDGVASGLSLLADVINAYVVPALQSFSEWAVANVIPALSSVIDWISANALPILQSVFEWIQANVLPVLQIVADTIVGSVIPALMTVGEFIIGSVIPIVADVVAAVANVLIPIISELVDFISGVVITVFEFLTHPVESATAAFESVVGAVKSAVDSLLSIPSAIGNMIGNAVGSVKSAIGSLNPFKKNATGTEYFGGGLTQINERGEEMIQLARGDKIYPAGKTEKIIKNDINKNSNNTTSTQVHAPVTMNIYTNDEKKVVQTMDAYFKRLGVLV